MLAEDQLTAALAEANRQRLKLLAALGEARDERDRAIRERDQARGATGELRELLFAARGVLEYVSRGRGYVGTEQPYPDAAARRVLAAIDGEPVGVPGG